jgi:hypothetical protein
MAELDAAISQLCMSGSVPIALLATGGTAYVGVVEGPPQLRGRR